MIFDYSEFDNSLLIRDFQRQDQRNYSLLSESPDGFKSKIATLSDNNLPNDYNFNNAYVDFILGMAESYDKYIFQIIYYDDKTGDSIIYGTEFKFEDGEEYTTYCKSEEYFNNALRKFKIMLKQDTNDYIVDRLSKLAKDCEIDCLSM